MRLIWHSLFLVWFIFLGLFPNELEGKIWNVLEEGMVAGDSSGATATANRDVLNKVFAEASPGDTVWVPNPAQGALYALGGILASGKPDLTFRLEGMLIALHNTTLWPMAYGWYDPFVQFAACQRLVISGGGVLDGRGMLWWDEALLNLLPAQRPHLLVVNQSSDVLVENLLLHNSPQYHVVLDDCLRAEVRNITVHVDREEITRAKAKARTISQRESGSLRASGGDFPLEPQDLNTDGIDPSGRDIWIHDCVIYNDDDSVAVKPCNRNCWASTCTENLLIERVTMHGFGASIGSVPPHPDFNCIRNVTFRDIYMPETGKGVYIKSNPECDTAGLFQGEIRDILYENVTMLYPRWWPIWIGPQQIQEPGTGLGRACSLIYPLDPWCPTQGCVQFSNIMLRDVLVVRPWFSPGVILGNSTVANMHNITFANVVVQEPGSFPYDGLYQCENVDLRVLGTTQPVPKCVNI